MERKAWTAASDWADIKEIFMAKVIEFHVPKSFRKPLKWASQLQCGKLLSFARGQRNQPSWDRVSN